MKKRPWVFYLLLILTPCAWWVADYTQALRGLNTLALSALYRLRGPLKEGQGPRIFYVDLDSRAIALMGERPFPRIFYAEVVDALFRYGNAKAVGIDIVFSDAAHSFLVDPQKVSLDNQALQEVIAAYPSLVLAAAYTPRVNPLTDTRHSQGIITHDLAQFPLLYRGFDRPETHALPEQPGISLIGTTGGNLGLINVDEQMPLSALASWVPLFAHTPGPTYYTLALVLFCLYHDLDPQSAIHVGKQTLTVQRPDGSVVAAVPLTYGQLLEVNWFSPFFSPQNPRYSMADILTAKAWLSSEDAEQRAQAQALLAHFEDALVLIGPVDPMLQDLSKTPVDSEPAPRVGIHGNLLKTLLNEAYLIRPWPALEALILAVLSTLIGYVCTLSQRYKTQGLWHKLAGLIILGLYTGAVYVAFKAYHILLPLVAPLGAGACIAFGCMLVQLIDEERQKSRIKGLFGTYLSPELVKTLVESHEEPKLGGVEVDISAFFSDIQDFSSFSEQLSPTLVVGLMNEYLQAMTALLQAQQGTLDKYIGDAIVGIFGAPIPLPDHAYRACKTACLMLQEQNILRARWQAQGACWPPNVQHMHTRIGINTGPAIVGNMGSAARFNYTMMGDSVNLAARCESGAKAYGVYTMTTEYTYQRVQQLHPQHDIVFRLLDRIIVKGKTQSVAVYEILGLKGQVAEATLEAKAYFEKGLGAYFDQNWTLALQCFGHSARLEPLQTTQPGIERNPSEVFLQRCSWLAQHPPGPGWDGVFKMKDK